MCYYIIIIHYCMYIMRKLDILILRAIFNRYNIITGVLECVFEKSFIDVNIIITTNSKIISNSF